MRAWQPKRGMPLTEAEEQTVRELAAHPSVSVAELAEALNLHTNSVKYRLVAIADKWDLSGRHHRHLAVLLEAIRRGYSQPDAATVLEDFVAYLLATLPAGRLTPLAVGLRLWLEGEATRFLRDRQATDEAEAA